MVVISDCKEWISICVLQYSALDEVLPRQKRYRQCVRTNAQVMAYMVKVVRRGWAESKQNGILHTPYSSLKRYFSREH